MASDNLFDRSREAIEAIKPSGPRVFMCHRCGNEQPEDRYGFDKQGHRLTVCLACNARKAI